MSKKHTERLRRERFFNEMLPVLEERLDVVKFPYFIKVRGTASDYDYYPGAEKLNIRTKDGKQYVNNWCELSYDNVLEYFGIEG